MFPRSQLGFKKLSCRILQPLSSFDAISLMRRAVRHTCDLLEGFGRVGSSWMNSLPQLAVVKFTKMH